MAYVSTTYKKKKGKVVGNGQCVTYIHECAKTPPTRFWKKGKKIKSNKLKIKEGTAIATFDNNGNYPNQPTGNHAAIYVSHDALGMNVYDQWVGHPVGPRYIRFKGGTKNGKWPLNVNDGDDYYVIE